MSIAHQLALGVRAFMLDIHKRDGVLHEACKNVARKVEKVENECHNVTRRHCREVSEPYNDCHTERRCHGHGHFRHCARVRRCETRHRNVRHCTPSLEKVCGKVRKIITVNDRMCEGMKWVGIPESRQKVSLCHGDEGKACRLTALALRPGRIPRDLSYDLKQIATYLREHRQAVVTINFESYIGNHGKVMEQFRVAGAQGFVFNHNVWIKGKGNKYAWPTLDELRRTNKRLVVFSSKKADGFPMWDQTIETAYNLKSHPNCGERGESKGKFSGKDPRPLLTMNHFYSLSVQGPEGAGATIPKFGRVETHDYNRVNDVKWINERVKKCVKKFGRVPNFIAVDYFEKGKGGGAITEVIRLNQLPVSAFHNR